MPAILRFGPYRFLFYSVDRGEPIHVHVERDDFEAKFWLKPIRLAYADGFSKIEIRRIERIISKHHGELTNGWNKYFNPGSRNDEH